MSQDRQNAATRDASAVSDAGMVVPPHHGGETLEAGAVLFDRYRIVRLLGQGGAGVVYEAIDQRLDIAIALKLLHRGRGDTQLERLRQELVLARRVSHPSVCRVFDLACDGEGPDARWFITMELLVGESLRDRLRRCGRLPLPEVSSIASQLVAGLDVAHAAGVIHRDLTPANVILVTRDGRERAVITDFGIAVSGDEIPPHLRTAGTPAYMAPEQIEGAVTTFATDVFSLGVVLYEALGGELPWRAGPEVSTAARRLRELPAGWNAALARALTHDPARRFQSVRAFEAALVARRPSRRLLASGLAVGLVAGVATFVAWPASGAHEAGPVARDAKGPVGIAFPIGGGGAIVEGVAELADGDLIVVGHTYAPFAPRGLVIEGCNGRCGFVARLSATAELRWGRALGGDAEVRCHGPAIDGDQVVVVGQTAGSAAFAGERAQPGGDGFVLALSLADGKNRWFRRLGAPGSHVRGVASDDGTLYVTADLDARVTWDGSWRVRRDVPGASVMLVSYDRDGNQRWSKWLSGGDQSRFLGLAAANGVVLWAGGIGGAVRGSDVDLPAANQRTLVFHYDATGTQRWMREVTSSGSVHVTAVDLDRDGTAVLAGWMAEDMQLSPRALTSSQGVDGWVARIDTQTGAARWLAQIGGDQWDSLTDIQATPDGVWVAGRSIGGVSARAPGALFAAFSRDGVERAVWTLGGTGAKGRAVNLGPSGIWVTGTFRQTMKAGSFELSGNGIKHQGFVVQLNDHGTR